MKNYLIILLLTGLSLSSCMMTRTPVGQYIEQPGKEYTYDKGKQMWLFWGIVPVGRTHVNTPSSGDCEVITKFRFTDALISTCTLGLVTSYSIKVKAKKVETSAAN